jgi:hypothetical protein
MASVLFHERMMATLIGFFRTTVLVREIGIEIGIGIEFSTHRRVVTEIGKLTMTKIWMESRTIPWISKSPLYVQEVDY